MKYYRIVMKNSQNGEVWYKTQNNNDIFSQKKEDAYPFAESSIKKSLRVAMERYQWPNIKIDKEEI